MTTINQEVFQIITDNSDIQQKTIHTYYAIPLESLQTSDNERVDFLKLSPNVILKKLVDGNLCLINTDQVRIFFIL